ncbi:MAG: malectin domain-containing carbohydrate-binding protein, partial [Kiritimatiellae bacterium]|nr:malectin domain-containing carbohydrate-binding protein [Kiritimatiellia bacterium]
MKSLKLLWLVVCWAGLISAAVAEITIVIPKKASFLENIAALEIRRYMYLRMGKTVPIPAEDMPKSGDVIIVAQKDHSIVKDAWDDATKATVAALEPEQYLIKTISGKDGQKTLVITGGDAVGMLYGTYRVCEKIGVRFYLHGDVIPEKKIPMAVPEVNETGKPLFNIRGINPFHDFPEGPDWWNKDDYMSYISQLAKMRMNFMGLHCYPEGGVGPEPAVWIGMKKDLDAKNKVKFSYPSKWANTDSNGTWGYAAMKTGEFAGGADKLFESDDYGPEIMAGMMPKPEDPEKCNELFEKAGKMFKAAFGYAKKLGVKTCIGTETPLTIPKLVREKIEKEGGKPSDQTVVKEVYEGMFTRIAKIYPVDYYWLWTPEGWTWGGNKPEQFEATVKDIQSALEALASLGNPFTLATCGWVLGPQHDRAALDKVLPKAVPMSCISRQVGHAAVEVGFANIEGRPKWSIPWMENDPNLIAPQPWVGRMRYDAADSLRLGCTGLIGIHWRAKAMAQNVSALAAAGWDQSWTPADFDKTAVVPSKEEKKGPVIGAIGGSVAHFTAPVEDTEDDKVYQSVRYSMDGYNLEIPNGIFNITLKFNEPHYGEAGKRIFGAKIQGKQVINKLDVFAKAGKNKALDYTYQGIAVTNGFLFIDFIREVENPCIAGIVVEGKTDAANQIASAPYTRKINCGGKAYKDYEADEKSAPPVDVKKHRTMPVEDF